MAKQAIPHRVTGASFLGSVQNLTTSEVGGQARWMFVGLIAFLFAINGMNVVNSYVGRDFMTAIADRNRAEFIRQAFFYLGVFAISTLLSVFSRYTEERLGLLWRGLLTRQAVDRYLAEGSYYRLEAARTLANPDERITEDVRTFTVTTLSFVLMVLNSSFTVVAFAGVLWSISPLLFLVAVGYAAGGSLMTILLGRPLIRLNYDQLDREADFRSRLVHVRENAEEILLAGAEAPLQGRLVDRLGALIRNFGRIIGVNRNLGFFTTGYNWLIQIIPALIIAPAYMDGRVEFGVVTQSAMAFSTLVAAFSLIITQFQSISSFAAVVARLSSLVEAVEERPRSPCPLETRPGDGGLGYEGLSLSSDDDGRALITGLSIEIPPGVRVLVRAGDGAATVALFRATAELEIRGEGCVKRPAGPGLRFLAERPYLPPVGLRSMLVPTRREGAFSDERLLRLLGEWDLEVVVARAGGLDREQDWDSLLTLAEQQLLACVRVLLARPQLVLLDRPATALGAERIGQVLERLAAASIGYVQLGGAEGSAACYEAILEIHGDGGWGWVGEPPVGTAGDPSELNASEATR
ncbi:MAG: ABC transporter ATP-binding protein/permease [Bdellovibrio bacteriovorus]